MTTDNSQSGTSTRYLWSSSRARQAQGCVFHRPLIMNSIYEQQGWNANCTLFKAMPIVLSRSSGVLSNNKCEDSLSRGKTLMKIKLAMNSEQRGSAMYHPNCSMKIEDKITPTLPIVSATTWRKTPAIKRHKWTMQC